MLDFAMIVLAIAVALVVRFGSPLSAAVKGFSSVDYSMVSVLLCASWMLSLQLNQAYKPELFGIGTEEYRRIGKATFGVFGALAIIALLAKIDVARGYLAIAFPLGLVLLLVERSLVRQWIIRRRANGDYAERSLILGSPAEVRHAAEAIRRNPSAGYVTTAVAVASDPKDVFELADETSVPNRGSVKDISTAIHDVDVLIIAGQAAITARELRAIGWKLEGTPTKLALASSMTDVAGPRIHRRPVEGLPLMNVESPSYSGTKFVVKRCMDVALSGAAILVLSPVFALIAACVYFQDRGPVLFRQTRVGVNGRLFKMSKFRSMVVNAEQLRTTLTSDDPDGVLFKMRDDPRITPVGKFIRGYSLDELPQLFDVLMGHMSLVGPRPPLPDEVRRYESHVHRRLNVKPGVTGPWQVGGRSNLTWAESVQKDLYYVENWSVIGDVSILLRTIAVVFKRDGAH
nr:sugar transferase [Flexivirga meconopsidis]